MHVDINGTEVVFPSLNQLYFFRTLVGWSVKSDHRTVSA